MNVPEPRSSTSDKKNANQDTRMAREARTSPLLYSQLESSSSVRDSQQERTSALLDSQQKRTSALLDSQFDTMRRFASVQAHQGQSAAFSFDLPGNNAIVSMKDQAMQIADEVFTVYETHARMLAMKPSMDTDGPSLLDICLVQQQNIEKLLAANWKLVQHTVQKQDESPSAPVPQERVSRRSVKRWSKEETARLHRALEMFGRKWDRVALFVGDRSAQDCRSKVQKELAKGRLKEPGGKRNRVVLPE